MNINTKQKDKKMSDAEYFEDEFYYPDHEQEGILQLNGPKIKQCWVTPINQRRHAVFITHLGVLQKRNKYEFFVSI